MTVALSRRDEKSAGLTGGLVDRLVADWLWRIGPLAGRRVAYYPTRLHGYCSRVGRIGDVPGDIAARGPSPRAGCVGVSRSRLVGPPFSTPPPLFLSRSWRPAAQRRQPCRPGSAAYGCLHQAPNHQGSTEGARPCSVCSCAVSVHCLHATLARRCPGDAASRQGARSAGWRCAEPQKRQSPQRRASVGFGHAAAHDLRLYPWCQGAGNYA